jgi:hypothetical protein
METQLEHMLRQHQLDLWAQITRHFPVTEEKRKQIHNWIVSGRLKEKSMEFIVGKVQPVPHDNTPSSHHHL